MSGLSSPPNGRAAVRVLVRGRDGLLRVCRPREAGGWHCGFCKRGVLAGRLCEKCRICRAKVMQ
jgi:hypothetical protein